MHENDKLLKCCEFYTGNLVEHKVESIPILIKKKNSRYWCISLKKKIVDTDAYSKQNNTPFNIQLKYQKYVSYVL